MDSSTATPVTRSRQRTIEMSKIRITQNRSNIKRPKDQKRTLIALGLKKMNQTVEHEDTPQILGMVRKIAHLVKVEEA